MVSALKRLVPVSVKRAVKAWLGMSKPPAVAPKKPNGKGGRKATAGNRRSLTTDDGKVDWDE